ncbi:uncharacterized protein [Dermacentor albipictus]|uniref:uncharacterized protein isoform X3 n=1 Tax=Dermacentor albipictus TaxID=60249 RepID=UPI0038FC93FC
MRQHFDAYLLDPIPEILGGLCETLSSVTDVIGIDLDCNLLQLDTQALCEDKIKLTLPATLNLTECFGQVPFTCIRGKVLTEPLLKGFTVLVAIPVSVIRCPPAARI